MDERRGKSWLELGRRQQRRLLSQESEPNSSCSHTPENLVPPSLSPPNIVSPSVVPHNLVPPSHDDSMHLSDSPSSNIVLDSPQWSLDNTPNNERCPKSNQTLSDELRQWALLSGVGRNHLTSLLKILRKFHPELPNDSRTFLGTPSEVSIISMPPGSYVHFGLDYALNNLLSHIDTNHGSILLLSINIDGASVFNSNAASVWPILVSIFQKQQVAPFGIFYGTAKPNLTQFLQRFVEEYNNIYSSGFQYHGTVYSIELKNVVCDTPAKSYILNVKGHTGYSSCVKCTVQGSYNCTVYFPCTSINPDTLRTDEQYRSLEDHDFHLGPTPLSQLNGFNFIKNVPYDYMHLICLGVVKKLLELWQKSKMPFHINSSQVSNLRIYFLFVIIHLKNSVEK